MREYLDLRKQAGRDAPATTREIFDALKEGGFSSGAKDEATGMVVLRTMLRKNTTMFAKLNNGKIGLRAWYPTLKPPKEAAANEQADEADTADEDYESMIGEETATAAKPEGKAAAA